MYLFTVLLYTLLLDIDWVMAGVCPKSEDILPCSCDANTIKCFANFVFDLDQVFKAIANGRSENELQFETFELTNPLLTVLEDSIFHGLRFKTVRFLYCERLVCISPNAFAGTERVVTNFIAIGTNLRWDQKAVKECNVFNALRRFVNLKQINITGSNINEIPANAFEPLVGQQTQLSIIDLSGGQGGKIAKIGKHAFAPLIGLKYIDISSHNVSSIENYGFAFIRPSKERLEINLENNQLSYDSFGTESFEMNGRITSLRLGANPKIFVLEESVFKSYLFNKLVANERNSIDMNGTPLSCSAKNLWILENKSVLQLQHKITNALSTDGRAFWVHSRSECNQLVDPNDAIYTVGPTTSTPPPTTPTSRPTSPTSMTPTSHILSTQSSTQTTEDFNRQNTDSETIDIDLHSTTKGENPWIKRTTAKHIPSPLSTISPNSPIPTTDTLLTTSSTTTESMERILTTEPPVSPNTQHHNPWVKRTTKKFIPN